MLKNDSTAMSTAIIMYFCDKLFYSQLEPRRRMVTGHKNNKSITDRNGERVCSWLVFLFFLIGFYASNSGGVTTLFNPQFGYQGWEISEWLINYEGGFVRRGITGQLLLELEQLHLYDVRIAIQLVYMVSSLVVLYILYRIFKTEGWSPLLLPTGMCVGFTLFNLWGRKDFVILSLAFAIFLCYRLAVTRSSKVLTAWFSLYILAALQLLVHEAAFFFTYPILMLHSYHTMRATGHSRARSTALAVMFFLPVLTVMAVVCLSRGDKGVADAIWASWGNVFAAYPSSADPTQVGLGVQALGWDMASAFAKHLYGAFVGNSSPSLWRVPLTMLVLLSVYYLITRIDISTMGKSRAKPADHMLLSNVALVQFISLVPMFTILSCDWGRTLPYWVLSTLMFYHVFHHDGMVPFSAMLTRTSRAIQDFIDSHKPLSSPLFYLLLVLLTPIPNYYAPLDHLNTIQQRCCAYILDVINHITILLS